MEVDDDVVTFSFAGTTSSADTLKGFYIWTDCTLKNAQDLAKRLKVRFSRLSDDTLAHLTWKRSALEEYGDPEWVVKMEEKQAKAKTLVGRILSNESRHWFKEWSMIPGQRRYAPQPSNPRPDGWELTFDATPDRHSGGTEVAEEGKEDEEEVWTGPSIRIKVSNIIPQSDWAWARPHSIINLSGAGRLIVTCDDAIWSRENDTIQALTDIQDGRRVLSDEVTEAIRGLTLLALVKRGFDFGVGGPVAPELLNAAETEVMLWLEEDPATRSTFDNIKSRLQKAAGGRRLPNVSLQFAAKSIDFTAEDYARVLELASQPRLYMTYVEAPSIKLEKSADQNEQLQPTLKASIGIYQHYPDGDWYDVTNEVLQAGLDSAVERFNATPHVQDPARRWNRIGDAILGQISDALMSTISSRVILHSEPSRFSSSPRPTDRIRKKLTSSAGLLGVEGHPPLRFVCDVVAKTSKPDKVNGPKN